MTSRPLNASSGEGGERSAQLNAGLATLLWIVLVKAGLATGAALATLVMLLRTVEL